MGWLGYIDFSHKIDKEILKKSLKSEYTIKNNIYMYYENIFYREAINENK